jgi:hypothetical protein
VLFASKNNKDVDVVCERLRALLGDQQDWIVRLGNLDKIRKCREQMDPRLAALRDLPAEQPPSAQAVHELDEAVLDTRTRIEELAGFHEERSVWTGKPGPWKAWSTQPGCGLALTGRQCRSLSSLSARQAATASSWLPAARGVFASGF